MDCCVICSIISIRVVFFIFGFVDLSDVFVLLCLRWMWLLVEGRG